MRSAFPDRCPWSWSLWRVVGAGPMAPTARSHTENEGKRYGRV